SASATITSRRRPTTSSRTTGKSSRCTTTHVAPIRMRTATTELAMRMSKMTSTTTKAKAMTMTTTKTTRMKTTRTKTTCTTSRATTARPAFAIARSRHWRSASRSQRRLMGPAPSASGSRATRTR
ncbi:hypothetical protein SPRG_18519, partial [Saprolegnia parasitica CBS 223.65]